MPDCLLISSTFSSESSTTILAVSADGSSSWLDRLPLVLLFGIATSAESFEDRLLGNSLRYLEGEKFDVTQSDEIIEKLFSATVASTDTRLHIGPTLCRRMLDRQKDHVQNVQDFCDGLKYAYMSHFYASYPSIFLREGVVFDDVPTEAFEAVRNLPSFRRLAEDELEAGHAGVVRQLLESNEYLFRQITGYTTTGQQALSTLSHAAQVLFGIRASLQMSPTVRLSTLWTRAASGDIAGSPLLRETMLSVKKMASDKFVELLAAMMALQGTYFSMDLTYFQQHLDSLVEKNDTSAPLRTQHDVRNDSLRTTVVAQKVLLSKHTAALSEQDKAYSDLVGRFHDALEKYFEEAFIDPQTLFLSEVLIYDLKSPHTEVFQSKPRFAVERALATPHDYLGCDCCSGVDNNEAALSATQPATAIVYQMYVESGALINVSDLWSAFNAIAGDGNEDDESKTM
jgi:origin recognition complex subunit 3